MNIASALEQTRRRYPDRTAIRFEAQSMSYRGLDEEASRIANGLRGIGVGPGDRVALWLPNIPAFVTCYFAVLKLGAIVVSVSSGLTADEAGFILRDSSARALVTTAALRGAGPGAIDSLPALEQIIIAEGASSADTSLGSLAAARPTRCDAVDLAADVPASILYTSGTTGVPKGATLSHGNVTFNTRTSVRCCAVRPGDRIVLFLPLYHCFGQNAILNAAVDVGATVLLHRGFDPDRMLASIADDRATMFFGVPTAFIVLHDRATPAGLASIRYYFSAAAPLPFEMETKWHRTFGLPIHQGYGLTETSPFASYNHPTRYVPGSIGTPVDGADMRVVDVRTKQPLGAGETGEIVVRGPNVMLGYWNRPADTAETIRDGWLHTGDVGRMDTDGYFYVEDRLKDVVIVGGLNVYPAEVENVLYQHAAVAEVAVHGVPDPVMGERVRAVIVAKGQTSAAEIIAWCRERLSDAKAPIEVAFVGSLPKSRAGKVLKRVLRDEYVPPVSTTPAAMGRHDLERRIVDWLGAALTVDPCAIDLDTPFLELGLTSVLAVGLAGDVQQWVGRDVSPTVTWSFSTVRALTAHVLAVDAVPGVVSGATQSPTPSLSDADAEALLRAELDTLEKAAHE